MGGDLLRLRGVESFTRMVQLRDGVAGIRTLSPTDSRICSLVRVVMSLLLGTVWDCGKAEGIHT